MNNANILTFVKDPNWRYTITGSGDKFDYVVYRGSTVVTRGTRSSVEKCHKSIDLFTQACNKPERGRVER